MLQIRISTDTFIPIQLPTQGLNFSGVFNSTWIHCNFGTQTLPFKKQLYQSSGLFPNKPLSILLLPNIISITSTYISITIKHFNSSFHFQSMSQLHEVQLPTIFGTIPKFYQIINYSQYSKKGLRYFKGIYHF